jgi:hypothetical protein
MRYIRGRKGVFRMQRACLVAGFARVGGALVGGALVGVALVGVVLGAACVVETTDPVPTDSGGQGGVAGQGGGEGGQGGEPACGSASGELDETGLVELAFDDGIPTSNLRIESYAITSQFTYELNATTLNEAVRFDLGHPARVHGFKVMWAGVPDDIDPKAELQAGLYGDFGYNGFDFWEKDPLWTGTRCAEDVDDAGAWVTYKLETPLEIAQPGLVYVAHRAEPGQPSWWWDGAPLDDDCATFDGCQSSINLPTSETSSYYNGISFPFQEQYLVRLLVEYLDDVQPEDKFFQIDAAVPASGHVSWGDYDNDGHDDLLLGGALLHNQGDGTFVEATSLGVPATGGVWGDYDNDGCLDLFVFAEAHNAIDTLMKGDCAGGFTIPTGTGIVDQQSYNPCGDAVNNTASPTAAAAWLDVDADGLLDLYQANFLCWGDYSYYQDTVYRNLGNGTFEDISDSFTQARSASRTVAPIDHDGDGDIDVLVGNYVLQANLFFQNNGDGTFTESALARGLAGQPGIAPPFYYGHTIGLAWGDIDNDGDFDNITANLAHPRFFGFSDKTQVLINDGSGSYTDLSGGWTKPESAAGLRYQETHSVPALADFDRDGNLDLAITCVYDGRPSDFYWGAGDGTFLLDAYHAGITTENGWGIALSDHDSDGDVDLYATNLFVNTRADGGHWLETRVVGVSANWAAVGAVVKVKTGATTRIRHVQGGTGKGGQDSMYLHFGVGSAASVDEIRVVFPGGAEVVYPGPIAADQRVWLYQDETTVRTSFR